VEEDSSLNHSFLKREKTIGVFCFKEFGHEILRNVLLLISLQ